MLTITDVKKELDIAGCGPVIKIERVSQILGVSKFTLYSWSASGLPVKTGHGTMSRDSIEQLLLKRTDVFCNLYDYNHNNNEVKK